jgi:hypothetical protein
MRTGARAERIQSLWGGILLSEKNCLPEVNILGLSQDEGLMEDTTVEMSARMEKIDSIAARIRGH